MLYDGLQFTDTSKATNFIVDSGPELPSVTSLGELFYQTGELSGLFAFNGINWASVSVSSFVSIVGDMYGSGNTGDEVLVYLNPIGSEGSYGTQSTVPTFMTDDKGRIVSVLDIPININTSQISSGVFDNARISESSVRQYEDLFSLQETQIIDGNLLARVSDNETISGSWEFAEPVSIGEPSLGSHGTTKNYVDAAISGLSWKRAVKAGTTADIVLSGLQTIDGIILVDGDRILVKNQTTPISNGIYICSSSVWERSSDFNDVSPIDEINGAAVFIEEGSSLSDSAWTQFAKVNIIGVDSIQFAQFASTTAFVAGAGLVQIGNGFDIVSASSSRIVVNANDIDLALIGAPSTYRSVSIDGYGRVVSGSNPTTLAGYGITDAITKAYVDTSDYLNLPPLAGVLKDNTVPIYSDFKFSQGTWNVFSFALVDSEAKQVLFYSTDTPTGYHSAYRAYRYTDAGEFIYDNEPVSTSFLLSTEKIQFVLNMGTYFAVLRICTKTFPETVTRHVIVKTGGSSNWADWTLAYDVSALSLANGSSNYSLQTIDGKDRIIRVYMPDALNLELSVYDSDLSLLRTQHLYDFDSMVDIIDHSGQGRTFTNKFSIINYSGPGTVYPFTYNPFTETFHNHFSSYYTYVSGITTNGVGFGLSISWSIPKTWLDSGIGTLTNLIPIKSGSFRYHYFSDETWDTDNGGMVGSWSAGGTAPSILTDEYSGEIYETVKGSFDSSTIAHIFRLSSSDNYVYRTFGANNSAKLLLNYAPGIPDGSYWSKVLVTHWAHIIGNNIMFAAVSSRYGYKNILATFSTTSFSSIAQGQVNDTLKLDAPSALPDWSNSSLPQEIKDSFYPGSVGTTVIAGVPTYYFCAPNEKVFNITASGVNRNFIDTGISMPSLPITASGYVISEWSGISAWNGSISTPVFYAIIRDSTYQVFVAKCSSGTWTIPGTAILQDYIDGGKASRGDSNNNLDSSQSGQTLLTESGRLMFNFIIPYVGGNGNYWASYSTTADTLTGSGSMGSFAATNTGPGSYSGSSSGGYQGSSFGYSTTFGYYRISATPNYDAAFIISSKDIKEINPTISEEQWYNNSAPRHQMYITTESATGLVAYVSNYPLFIGGYYTSTPSQSVSLKPNSDNYVYATKSTLDRTTVTLSVRQVSLPSSFSRVLLAIITTNATNIISQISNQIIEKNAVEELSNVSIITKVENDLLVWSGTKWISKSLSGLFGSTFDTNGGLRLIVGTGSDVPDPSKGLWVIKDNSTYNGFAWQLNTASGVSLFIGNNFTEWVERFCVDVSGRVGIGTKPLATLHIKKSSVDFTLTDTSTPHGTSGPVINLQNVNNSAIPITVASIKTNMIGGAIGIERGELIFSTMDAGVLKSAVTITAGGDLFINVKSETIGQAFKFASASANYAGLFETGSTITGNYSSVMLKRTSTAGAVSEHYIGTQFCGSISVQGSTSTYNTSSDYRLKTNIEPLINSGLFIDSLRPKTFTWISDNTEGAGFIAHEFQIISPSSVSGTKDAVRSEIINIPSIEPEGPIIHEERFVPVYQSMQSSSAEVMANIIAELQDLRKRVSELEKNQIPR